MAAGQRAFQKRRLQERVKDPFHAEIKAMCTFRVEQKAARYEQVQSH